MQTDNRPTDLARLKSRLLREAEARLGTAARDWLLQAIEALAASTRVMDDLGLYSAMCRRKLGSAPLGPAEPIKTGHAVVDIQRWDSADCGRILLLIGAIERGADAAEIIPAHYRMADESERIALVKGLILFAPGDYLTDIALDAGRTNSLELLAALALDNPYPAAFYSDQAFNQMVLKALFQGLAIERVQGLQDRANTDLARMAESYVVEREQARRSVPVDIWLAIGPCASDTGRKQIIRYHVHEDIGHRYYCARALAAGLPRDPSLRRLLEQRLARETEPLVRELLTESLDQSRSQP